MLSRALRRAALFVMGAPGLLAAASDRLAAQFPEGNRVAESVFGPAASKAPAAPMPLDVEEMVTRRRFAWGNQVALSPNRQWAAYTLINPRRVQTLDMGRLDFTRNGLPNFVRGSELWVTDLRSGVARNLSGPRGVSWGGVWSPDGSLLAFYSDRRGRPQLWTWRPASGQFRRVSEAIVTLFYPFEVAAWTPDGRYLVMKVVAEMAHEGARPPRGTVVGEGGADAADTATVRVYHSGARDTAAGGGDPVSSDGASNRAAMVDGFVGDLAIVSLETGKTRRLVRRQAIASAFVSPAGGAVAYVTVRGFEAIGSQDNRIDVNVITLRDGRAHVAAANVRQSLTGLSVSWSPDSRELAYTTNTLSHSVSEDCYVVRADSGEPFVVTPGLHPPFSNSFQGPLWGPAGDVIYLLGHDTVWKATIAARHVTPLATVDHHEIRAIVASGSGRTIWLPGDGHALYVRTRNPQGGRSGVAEIDLTTGRIALLFEENARGTIDDDERFGVDAVDSTVVYLDEAADRPQDLWVTTDAFRHRSRLTHVNPALDKYVFGRSQLFSWSSLDGKTLRGTLLLPSDYVPGHRYPTLALVYGGGTPSAAVNDFGLESESSYDVQLLATRGFAVFAPDAPMSDATPMLDIAKVVLPAVNRVIDLGIADPERLGVMGESYGGYTTLALLAQTTRFRAAATVAGTASNLFTEYGQMDARGFNWGTGWAERGQGRMRSTPWERRDRYVENSPYFYLDRVTTPLLLIQGTMDEASPEYGSDELFTALRRLGREVEYAKYRGADHRLNNAPLAVVRDYQSRITDWFQHYLGGN